MNTKPTDLFYQIAAALEELSIPEDIEGKKRFFKTGVGEYGEGDTFIGVKVPDQRQVAKAFYKITDTVTLSQLLQHDIHEYRLTALFILVHQYQKAKTLTERKRLVDFYLEHKAYINNWDLVDSSTHKILAPYVHETKSWHLLLALAREDNMWSKRIAVVALWTLWKEGYTSEGLDLILLNLTHPHDLMHKANGWMLRELAAYDEEAMLQFVEKHYQQMPRTTLRYAIEKLDETQRKQILKGQL